MAPRFGITALTFALIAAACSGSSPEAIKSTEPPPVVVDGGEIVYSFLDNHNNAIARGIVEDSWNLPRFDPVDLPSPPTWTEDPYNEKYWQFIFYSLRPTRHLLGTYLETEEPQFRIKLIDIVESFVNDAGDSPYVDDPHTAAFRAMVLVNTYMKLQRRGELPERLEPALRATIEDLAAFLSDGRNYESDFNHAVTEAAALLLISQTFTTAPQADEWRDLALERLSRVVEEVVGSDGVEVENSPFYHFYVMAFLSEIARWAETVGVGLGPTFTQRVAAMVDYATVIAMPNGLVPLLGSTVQLNATRYRPDVFERFEEPVFEHMRTGGLSGAAPSQRLWLFPSAGHAVLRSGYGETVPYEAETHVTFDVGAYRTSHSQLDALSVNVYAAGRSLLPDSGLFTYESGSDGRYFESTAAHNTVVVDGGDQIAGDVVAGLSIETDDYLYQSGRHTLYQGVDHRRAVLILDRDLILVIDGMNSASSHRYEQMWHAAPGVVFEVTDGDEVVGSDSGNAIVRLVVAATGSVAVEASPPGGLIESRYSDVYEKSVDTSAAVMTHQGSNGHIATLVAAGHWAAGAYELRVASTDGVVALAVCGGVDRSVVITDLAGPDEAVTVTSGGC